MPTEATTDRLALGPVQALARGLLVLRILATEGRSLTAAEISARSGLHPSTLSRLLDTLLAERCLQITADGRYRPGPFLLVLSRGLLDQDELIRHAEPHLEELARASGLIAQMGILYEGQVLYVAHEAPPGKSSWRLVGRRIPIHCTGLGKVLLAGLPPTERRALLDVTPLRRYTEHTIVDRAVLEAQLDEVQRRGYALDEEEGAIGCRCLAVPVRGSDSRVVAALSVAGLPSELHPGNYDQVYPLVMRCANRIAFQLGCRDVLPG